MRPFAVAALIAVVLVMIVGSGIEQDAKNDRLAARRRYEREAEADEEILAYINQEHGTAYTSLAEAQADAPARKAKRKETIARRNAALMTSHHADDCGCMTCFCRDEGYHMERLAAWRATRDFQPPPPCPDCGSGIHAADHSACHPGPSFWDGYLTIKLRGRQ